MARNKEISLKGQYYSVNTGRQHHVKSVIYTDICYPFPALFVFGTLVRLYYFVLLVFVLTDCINLKANDLAMIGVNLDVEKGNCTNLDPKNIH